MTKSIATALTAAAVAGGCPATPAPARGQPAHHRADLGRAALRRADNGRRGESLGDLQACRGRSATPRAAPRRPSPLDLRLPRLDPRGLGLLRRRRPCRGHAAGRRRAEPHEREEHVGGHRRHRRLRGARGTVQLRQLSAKRTAATVTLLP